MNSLYTTLSFTTVDANGTTRGTFNATVDDVIQFLVGLPPEQRILPLVFTDNPLGSVTPRLGAIELGLGPLTQVITDTSA